MVCYARPASRMAVVVLVVLLLFGRHVGHFFDTAALMVAITVAAGGAAAAAALAFAAFLSIRRRRAAAGGCVSCQLRCQHAMTEQPHRLLVVRAAEREATGPRWPDRPAYRSAPASRPAPAPRPTPAPGLPGTSTAGNARARPPYLVSRQRCRTGARRGRRRPAAAPAGHPSDPPAAGRRARAPAHAGCRGQPRWAPWCPGATAAGPGRRPRRPGQLPHLLEGQRRAAGRVLQHQPVLPFRVRLAGPGRLIARAVPQAEQLPVELGQAPRVGGVQDRLPDDRERLLIVHTATVGTGAVNTSALPPVRCRRRPRGARR